jgi:hypothetical protein
MRGFCVSIQTIPAGLWSLALCDCRWVRSGRFGDGRHPGVSGEGVAYCGEDVGTVLGGGGGVAADRVPVAGGFLRAGPSGDLLLRFRGAQVALGLVGGGRYPQVREEPQDVALAVTQAFQQRAAGFLPCLRAGHAADLLQPDEDGGPEKAQVSGDRLTGDGVKAGLAGLVRGVGEGAERAAPRPAPSAPQPAPTARGPAHHADPPEAATRSQRDHPRKPSPPTARHTARSSTVTTRTATRRHIKLKQTGAPECLRRRCSSN